MVPWSLPVASHLLAASARAVARRRNRSWLSDEEIRDVCIEACATPDEAVALMRAGVWRRVPDVLHVEVM